MLVEGQGLKRPTPVTITVAKSELLWLRDKADERRQYRAYERRQDAWGRGFIADPILVGMVGEHAVCRWLQQGGDRLWVDIVKRPNGDGGVDLVARGLAIQIKTRTKDFGETLVRRLDDWKQLRQHEFDVVVSVEWDGVMPQPAAPVKVQLIGWARRETLRKRFKRSPRQDAQHFNNALPDTDLLPMSDLRAELDSREAA